jgi:tRNA pseudouridine13 synthase
VTLGSGTGTRPGSPADARRPGEPVALGGRIRHEPDDFVVEEIPLLAPLGTGEHVLAVVEKRGLSTLDVLLFLSKALKVSERTIGYAGLKDARALTTQTVSIPRVSPERVRAVEGPRFRVLSAERHPHGVKIGHLLGNRFTIRIRGADLARVGAAEAALADLALRGMPNPYGEQRFGTKLDSHLLGRAIVDEDWAGFLDLLLGQPSALEKDPRMHAARGAWSAGLPDDAFALLPKNHRSEKRALAVWLRTRSPREAFDALGPHPKRIWVSAWQSWLFNRVLERRRADGTWDRLLPGDVAWLHASGALLEAGSGPEEAERAASLAASPTGPLPGYDQRLASGAPGAVEREVLRAEGADPEAFRAAHVRMRGSRRPLRVPVRDASLSVERPEKPAAQGAIGNVLVKFQLPPGAFATVLLDLLMAGPGRRPSPEAPSPEESQGGSGGG